MTVFPSKYLVPFNNHVNKLDRREVKRERESVSSKSKIDFVMKNTSALSKANNSKDEQVNGVYVGSK